MQQGLVMVSGAGNGLGRAVSELLLASGWSVLAVDLDEAALDALARQEGEERLRLSRCDVTERAALAVAIERAEEDLGPLVGQVNSAGVFGASDLLELDAASWQRIMHINAFGVLASMQAAAAAMLAHGRGSIVNVSSAAGRSGRANYAAYAASKAAVISLTRSAAAAWGPRGVRCNAVAPGVVETAMQDEVRAARDRLGMPAASDGGSPLGRIASPAEIAAIIAFLVSDGAGFINGQTINACGGIEFD